MTDWIVSMDLASAPRESKKHLILNATRHLLVERGFQDIVLDDVAREAGVAKGTLFLYYKSKDELFCATFADLADQMGNALDVVLGSGKKGRALLAEAVRTILAYIDRNRDFISQFGAGRFTGCGGRSSNKLTDKMAQNMRRMVRLLRRCAEDGAVRIKDMEVAALALFGLCRSTIFHRMVLGKEKSLDARTRLVMDLFLHGVSGG